MSDDEGFKRRSTRTAAIEAAKRIKNNAHANKLLSHGVKQEYQFDEAKIFKPVNNATINNGASHINTKRKCRKRKILDQALDSTVSPSKVQMHDSSTKMTKIVATTSSKHKDMPKRGRGRPPKAQSAKCAFTSNTSIKFEDTYDINVRRESYNASLLKNELTRPKLQPEYGGITYMESLMKFCKDLGPTARKIALRKLLGQGLNYQARHRLKPLMMPSSEARSYPCLVDVNSTNSSLRNAILNQVTQPLINFDALKTDATPDYKGKRIMVDDGTSNFNIWDDGDNLELLSSKQKTTINIGNNYQENINSVSGGYPYGSSENQDFVRKNFGYSQVGNWRPINQIGSLRTNNNGNLPQNINNINRIEDVEGFPRHGNLNLCVHPTTYVQPSRKIASSSFVMNGGVSSIPWVPAPLAPQNWYLPPPATKNSVVNDGFKREREFSFASTSCMQITDQQPKAWIENSWAQNQLSQQQLQNMQHQQHQIQSHQTLFNHDDFQPQDKLLMPMQTHVVSHDNVWGCP
ncbi:hypothetical protein LXL04_019083 [Taraxacum kok-saghyz]